jgi:hypothetical protein
MKRIAEGNCVTQNIFTSLDKTGTCKENYTLALMAEPKPLRVYAHLLSTEDIIMKKRDRDVQDTHYSVKHEDISAAGEPLRPTWTVNDHVSVNLTGLPGWKHHTHCHYHGVIVEVLADGMFRVSLDGTDNDGKEVTVTRKHLQRARDADTERTWGVGEIVHIRLHTGGVDGWWEAQIVGEATDSTWPYKFLGRYKDIENCKLTAHANDIRRFRD